MLRNLILLILIFFVTNISSFAFEPYLQKGALIKVYPKVTLSTESLEEGSKVYFIAQSDVWLLEKKAIEEGDIFLGHVSLLKMPIVGVNAAMKIEITDIIKKDGEKRQLLGKIIFPSGEVLGGNLTNPASYNQIIHPRRVYGCPWGGTLQYVPSGEYEQGTHVKVTPRDGLFIQLVENYFI